MSTVSVVREVMSKKVKTVSGEDTIRDALQDLLDSESGVLIVLEKQKPVGIVTIRDTARIASYTGMIASGISEQGLERVLSLPIKNIMSTHLITVTPNTSVWTAFDIMLKKRVRQLPVVEAGRLVGLVTDRALFRAVVAPSK